MHGRRNFLRHIGVAERLFPFNSTMPRDRDCDRYVHSYPDAHSDSYPNSHTHGYSNRDGNCYIHAYADSDCYSYGNSYSYGDADGDCNFDAYTYHRAEANTDAKAAAATSSAGGALTLTPTATPTLQVRCVSERSNRGKRCQRRFSCLNPRTILRFLGLLAKAFGATFCKSSVRCCIWKTICNRQGISSCP